MKPANASEEASRPVLREKNSKAEDAENAESRRGRTEEAEEDHGLREFHGFEKRSSCLFLNP